MKLLISGYGGENAESIALYEITENCAEQLWADTIPAPSFLCVSENLCFTLKEEENSASLVCYRWNGRIYQKTDCMDFEAGLLCHIAYLPRFHTLYGACYGTGHVIAVPVADGQFQSPLNFFTLPPARTGGLTRAHCCAVDPSEQRLLAANIAADRIYCYPIEEGKLIPNQDHGFTQLKQGTGPRHMQFHPNGKLLYVTTEYSNEVICYRYDSASGTLAEVNRVTALPDGFSGTSYCSGISVSADGAFLYAANRGANTIAVFHADAAGAMEKAQDFDCGGDWPRHIILSGDGENLLIANQRSNNIIMASVSHKDGTLTDTGLSIGFQGASCVLDVTRQIG